MNSTLFGSNCRVTSRTSAISLLSCVVPFLCVQAHAQTAARNPSELEEVVVTAQKRSESVQKVPIAMQAYSGEQLRNGGVSQITDIVQMAPNLNVVVQNSLSQHIVIRGVGTNEFFGNAPSSVGTYMDEVTMNNSYMSTLALYDMQRVEVLRGPQNSLFGRNTTGGAVNYITTQPKVGAGTADSFAQVTYGRDNLIEAEGGVTLPTSETTALRLAGIYHSRDGVWNNLDTGDGSYGNEKRYSGRATFAWEPNAATRLTVNVHSARSDGEAQPQKMAGAMVSTNPPLRMNDLAGFTSNIDWVKGNLNTIGNVSTVNVEGFNRLTTRWQDVWNGGSQRAELRVDGGYVKFGYDFGAATLTSITSYDKTHAYYEEDNTGNGNIAGAGSGTVTHDVLVIDMDQSYKQFTQELRLSSNDNEAKLRWIAGLYFLKEDSLLAQDIRFGDNGFPGAHLSANGILLPFFPDLITQFDAIPNPYGNTVSFSIADMTDKSASAYGQLDFGITRRLSATVGARFTHDDKSNPSYYAGAFAKGAGWDPSVFLGESELRSRAAGLPACVPKTSPTYIPFVRCADVNTSRQNLKDDELGGKLGLQYQLAEDVMFYGSYSRGFKSGKFDMEFLHTDDTPFPQRPLKPETLDAFELGIKSTLLDRTLMLNAAVFFNFWKDQQVFNVGVNGPEFFNLPESEIHGAEVEASWVPAEAWLVTGSIGLLDSKLTDVTGIDYDLHQGDFQKGHELPLAPNFTANAGVSRNFNIGANRLTVYLDGRYQSTSKVKYSPQVPIDQYEARFELNARAAYDFGMERQYQLSLYGDNLTNEKYCAEIQDLRGVSGSFYCVPNDGQLRWGLQMRVNF